MPRTKKAAEQQDVAQAPAEPTPEPGVITNATGESLTVPSLGLVVPAGETAEVPDVTGFRGNPSWDVPAKKEQ